MAPVVFIDCEFTSLEAPRLLSLGLVTSAGAECYLEWDLAAPQSSPVLACANTFVQDTVLPQFGRLQDTTVVAGAEFGLKAAQWLTDLVGPTLEVAYDYHVDYDLLEAALADSPLWALLRPRLVPTHVGYLLGDDDALAAMQSSWRLTEARLGIERHHALADAWALRAAYAAVHGLPPAP